ncbi:MAG: hypothetical protein AAFR61_03005 [Bacteroidota bacterium]
MPKQFPKLLFACLMILLVLGIVYVFALEEDQRTLNALKHFLKRII